MLREPPIFGCAVRRRRAKRFERTLPTMSTTEEEGPKWSNGWTDFFAEAGAKSKAKDDALEKYKAMAARVRTAERANGATPPPAKLRSCVDATGMRRGKCTVAHTNCLGYWRAALPGAGVYDNLRDICVKCGCKAALHEELGLEEDRQRSAPPPPPPAPTDEELDGMGAGALLRLLRERGVSAPNGLTEKKELLAFVRQVLRAQSSSTTR